MKKYLTIGGGLLTAISPFLPFVSILGLSVTLMESRGSVGWFFVGLGVAIALVGFLGKRWLNIASLLFGIIVAGLAVVYMNDASDRGGTAGIGIWVMMAGGVLAIVGSIMGMMKKSA